MPAPTSATFSAPFTWTSDLAITVARLNNMVGTGPAVTGGNLNYLYDQAAYAFNGRNAASVVYSAGNFTLGPSAAAYTAVSVGSLTMTLTCNTGRLMGYWNIPDASSDNTTHTSYSSFVNIVDGTALSGAGLAGINQANSSPNIAVPLWLPIYLSGLSVGSHTIVLGWANDGTASVQTKIFTSAQYQFVTGFVMEY